MKRKKTMAKEPINATDIKDGDTLFNVATRKIPVIVNEEELRKSNWVSIEDELPEKEGFYCVLTDHYLAQGIAYFFLGGDEEGENTAKFEVQYAVMAPPNNREPQVLYWLKDNHWGMLYDFKHKLKQI